MDSAPPERQEALRALVESLRDLDQAATKLQAAALWVLEMYEAGDDHDAHPLAETVRMLPVGTPRPGRPAVPPPAGPDLSTSPTSVTSDGTQAYRDASDRGFGPAR